MQLYNTTGETPKFYAVTRNHPDNPPNPKPFQLSPSACQQPATVNTHLQHNSSSAISSLSAQREITTTQIVVNGVGLSATIPLAESSHSFFTEQGIGKKWENGFEKLSTLSNLEALYLDHNSFNNSILSSLNTLSSLKILSLFHNKIVDIQGLRLSNLEFLDLSGNIFNNSILSSLSSLSSLKGLYLFDVGLKGCVDLSEISDSLRNLEALGIGGNQINKLVVTEGNGVSSSNLRFLNLRNVSIHDGKILLQSLGSFPSLKTLYLDYNNFSGIMSSPELHNFTNLESLYMSGSSVHISLLQSIAAFTSLEKLYMSNCQLNGILDIADLSNLKNLKSLSMDRTNLSTSVLQSIEQSTSLEFLSLDHCILEGTFYPDWPNLKNLKSLSMDGTNLSINILQRIGRLTSLEFLSLRNCNLEGIFPDQGGLCELKHLQHLYLSYNDIRGSLPWCFGNLTSLQVLLLSSNQFSGNISPLRALTSIQQLSLSSNQFSGNISPLTALTSIQQLSLSDNQFQIPISLEPFFNHSKLKYFDGDNNQIYADTAESHFSITPKFQLNSLYLSGCRDCVTFPKFLYHQHDLFLVDLSHNNLTGEFPNWLLDNNTNLRKLALVKNSLTGPLHLPTHQNLTSLDISNNFFHGNIPIQVGAYLPMLWSLNISINHFDGRIPSSIGDMKELSLLDLSYNKLSGGIPEHLAKSCINLRYLVLSNNSLEGQIFSAANFNLKYLMRLQLDGNQFIGKIPECLSNSSGYMTGLYLSDNRLSGRIPSWLGNMSELVDLIMPNNHLEGPIPPEFCQLQNLQVLNLAENNISGNLPSCFNPPQIQQVHLSRNKLQGQLKDAFFNSSSLVTLDLGYNRFNGGIPNWIGQLSNLSYLILTHNNLEGEVPCLLCHLEHLRLIDLSHNNLSGQIPPCLDMTALHGDYHVAFNTTSSTPGPPGASPLIMRKEETIEFTTKNISYSYQGRVLTYMSGVDLSCNKLTGEIPHQIGNLTGIHTLNLSYNNLTGSIPSTFSNLEQIESLDLSHNSLNGKIPPQIIELHYINFFSVAYNNLSGKTPERVAQFSTFEESSYRGNHLLCGPPLSKCCDANCSPSLVPKASTDIEEDSNFMDMDIFYISFTASYIVMVLAIAIILYVNPYWRRTWFYLVETWMTSCYYFIIDHLPKGFRH
ncbi:hypothetical protein EZV62_013294 [Acer yangbiense]|uniref:Disease resistance R13L4/SHOC-2-like LRR domain-containing protein n=1 Tax=Acer yangbiense TaxID=1000413 RepID=A0A5C7HXT8_9ROSI|nr:hypothetical protein EZV62_013294 [Acer yangbiense]